MRSSLRGRGSTYVKSSISQQEQMGRKGLGVVDGQNRTHGRHVLHALHVS